MFNLIGGVFCLVFLAMSWFLSTKIEKTATLRQNTGVRIQNTEFRSQNIEDKIQITEKKEPSKDKVPKPRKTAKPLKKIDKKPDSTFPIIMGIPIEREKTWQLKERRVALGPQAIVKINIKEEPLPLRGGLGVSAPREIKRDEVFPPNILLKKE
ncbi:MAG: hypothetical protein V2A53_10030 [bacterium]